MTNIELVLNMLAEVTTTALSKSKQPDTVRKNMEVAKEGGSVAKTQEKILKADYIRR